VHIWPARLLQRVRADGLDTGTTVNVVAGTPISATVRLSSITYQDDSSVVVSAALLNAGANVIINEIALEEETLLTGSPCQVRETPSLSIAFGYLTISGTPAPIGTVVTAESPRGDVVGCYVVGTDGSPAGQYNFMPIYGEDTTVSPAIPGMRDGELVTFRVDGATAQATPRFYWHDDQAPHQADLAAVPMSAQAILLSPDWNPISFRVDPPVPLVEVVLASVAGKYCRVLGEEEIYDCNLPAQFRTLRELHGGKAFYLRLDGGASANLLVEGTALAADTPLSLHQGWNYTGYLPQGVMTTTVAPQSIAGVYQRVLSMGQYYDIRYPGFSTLKLMQPGLGYLIYATQAATLTYPAEIATTSAGESLTGFDTPVRSAEGCEVTATPSLILLFGSLIIKGQPAPVGTRVEALTPRGEIAGCHVVDTAGQYGFMFLYGEDASADPVIPGFRPDEPVRLRVNGMEARPAQDLLWQDDLTPHRADLILGDRRSYLPMVGK